MTITARDIIGDALGDIAVLDPGETMTGEMATTGLRTLNRVIDRWRAQRLYVYAIKDVTATFSGATASVGTGLTINTEHPQRFEDGCFYRIGGIDYRLPKWDLTQYNSLYLKTTAGQYPQGFYYDRAIPGTVSVWPVPSTAIEYHFMVATLMSSFADLDTAYSFPDGYADAFHYTMCERLAPGYNLPPDPVLNANARAARTVIKKLNTQVPLLQVIPLGPARANILTGDIQ
jgi:hypothetical protein